MNKYENLSSHNQNTYQLILICGYYNYDLLLFKKYSISH